MVIRLLVVLEIRSGGPRCHQGPCSWEHECRKIKICENASCICWDVLLDKGKVWLAAGARWKARLLPRVWTGLDHLDSIVYNLSKQTNKLKWPKLQGLTNLVFSEVCTSITFQRANEVKLGLNKSQHGAFFWQIDQLSWFEFTQKAIVRFCHIITKCQLSVIHPQNTGHIWWICSWFQLLSGELPVPLIVFGINHSYIHLLSVITIISWKKRERRRFLCWITVLMRCQQWICDGVSSATWPRERWTVQQLWKSNVHKTGISGDMQMSGNYKNVTVKYSITRWQYLQVLGTHARWECVQYTVQAHQRWDTNTVKTFDISQAKYTQNICHSTNIESLTAKQAWSRWRLTHTVRVTMTTLSSLHELSAPGT